jgi:receptor protein-tyrosine kinase
VDLRGYLRALRRSLLLIVGCVVFVVGAVVIWSQSQDDVYQSKARVIVSSAQAETSDAYAGGLLSEQRAASYVELIRSGLLADRVRDEVGLDPDEVSIDDLVDHIGASVVLDSAVLELTFTDGDPARAQEILQAYADQLVSVAADIETPDDGGTLPTKTTVIDQASYQPKAIAPRPFRNAILGLMLGLVLGVSIALLRQLLDTTISTSEDLESVTDVPVLGTITSESGSSRRKLITELEHHAPRVEAFRVLRTNVQFVEIDSEHRTFVITSSMKEEGKTSTAVNLALTLARAGVKTLLVDGDLRRPRVAEVFDIDDAAGVTTLLLGRVQLEDAVWKHESGLHVLTSGVAPPNAAELLQTKAMAQLLERVRAEYEIVLIDSPPLLPVTDAALLAARADGTLLVVRHGRTKRDQLDTAIERLAAVDVTPVGMILNGTPSGKKRFGLGDSSYGGYGGYGTYASYQPTRRAQKRQTRRRARLRAER